MGVVRSLFKRLELLLRSFTLVSVPLIRVGDCKTKDPMSYFRLVSVMTATLTRESTYLICTARVYYVVAHLEFLPIKIVLEPWGGTGTVLSEPVYYPHRYHLSRT